MTARQTLNVAYASLTEGADQEQRGKFDRILEGTPEAAAEDVRKDNAKALRMLGQAHSSIRVGQVR